VTPIAAYASRPKPGETANGDRAFVRSTAHRFVAGVVDGLGHGPMAEEAAERAVAAVTTAGDVSVAALFDAAHAALRGTRGAALTLVLVEGARVTAAGVGNVALRTVRGAPLPFIGTPGIVGGNMRSVRVAEAHAAPTRFVLHSDGVSSRFASEPFADGSPADASERLLAELAGTLDDATVLVVDVMGPLPPRA
jgi:hypothetical protein